MSRQHPPDRLAAILAELDEGRRTPWLPDEDELIDRRPVLGAWRRRRGETAPATGTQARHPEPDQFPDPLRAPHSRAERRAHGGSEPPALRPHTPLFRTPLPDTDIETRPGRSALIGALLVLTLVAIVFGFRAWAAGREAAPTPLAVPTSTGSPGSRPSGAPSPTAGNPRTVVEPVKTTTGFVLVHVVGQVRRPGVVRLPAGSRVDDAIKAAGGALPGADLSAVNLARSLGDGEQVQVPEPGQTPSVVPAPSALSGASTAGATAGPVNLNTATEAELDTLPGVGPVLAARIASWRTTNGRFTSADELGEVSGIGDKLLEQLRPLVTL